MAASSNEVIVLKAMKHQRNIFQPLLVRLVKLYVSSILVLLSRHRITDGTHNNLFKNRLMEILRKTVDRIRKNSHIRRSSILNTALACST